MKTNRTKLVLLFAMAASLATTARGGDSSITPPVPPTENHKVLSALVGDFNQESKIHVGPGDPIIVHSIGHGKWIMGDHFVEMNMTAAPGEKTKGERMLIYGYDPSIEKYTMVNFDSESLASTTATGTYDATTRTLTFAGEKAQPGKPALPFRWVLKLEADGTIVQSILVGSGENLKETVTVTHTPRRPKSPTPTDK